MSAGQDILAHLDRGFAEADVPSCILDARNDFTFVSANGTADDKTLAIGAEAYLDAIDSFKQGNFTLAASRSHLVVNDYPQAAIFFRALSLLVTLLSGQPNSIEWQFVTKQLDAVSLNNNFDGIALSAIESLALHEISQDRPTAGIDRLRRYLALSLPIQERLEAQVALLEVLVAAKQYQDAEILTVQVDGDIGNLLLAPAWRVRYLAVSSAAWLPSQTPEGQVRHKVYEAGLQRATKEMQ